MVKKISDILIQKKEKRIEKPKLVVNKFFILFICLVFLGLAFYFVYGYTNNSLKIIIFPKNEIVKETFIFKADPSVKEANIKNSVVPGYVMTTQLYASDTFESTGEKKIEEKARGKIVVYNNYSSSPRTFVKGTRFLSGSGKLFRSTEQVVVPGKKGNTPGQVEVEVVADKPGPDYNIEPTTFSIPAFVGTNMYTFFYAKSFEKFKGGEIKVVKSISEDDIQKAKSQLQERLKNTIKNNLDKKAESLGYLVFYESLDVKFEDINNGVKEGQQVEKFLWEIKADAKVLAINKKDLEKLANNILQEKILKENKNKIYKGDVNIKLLSGDVNFKDYYAVVKSEASFKFYDDINTDEIKEKLISLDKGGIITLLNSYNGIKDYNIVFEPFFVQIAPKDKERINIVLKFD